MPAQRRRNLRVLLTSVVLLAYGAAAAASPELELSFGRQELHLSVVASSNEQEEAILNVVHDRFAGIRTRVDFQTKPNSASNWSNISAALLDAIAATVSAQASIQDGVVRIRAVSKDIANFEQQLSVLRDLLPGATVFDVDVITLGSGMAASELCAKSFGPIAAASIHFRQTSTRIRDSFMPLLDRIIEFAYDCRDATIAIIGHTDSTGEESWNQQVSLARAQAVADFLTARGVEPGRLHIEGAGSTQPIGDNGTVAGRERNRRIEFELR